MRTLMPARALMTVDSGERAFARALSCNPALASDMVLPVVLPGPDGNDAAAVDRLPLTP